MNRYFEYNDNKSSRFWEISLNGNLVITSYGKTGTQGKESTRSFASEPAAQKEADKLIREKTGKGYVETSHPDNPVKPDKPVRSSKTSPFRIMTAQDLFARYGDRISDRFRQYYDADAGLNALVYAGEAFIDGMLDITGQYFSNFKDMIAPPVPGNMENSPVGAVIVIGNLDITGNLVNKDAHNPFLYVSGNVKARNLVCGNSIMIVGENVNIDEATLCYGANGLLEVGGTLTTAWLDKGDHPFSIGGTRVMFRKDIDTMRRSDMFRNNIQGYDDALRTLFTGGSVFAASDNDTDDNDYDCWMEQVKKNGKKLKNVPGSLVDDGMCLAALINTSDAIKYVPGRILTEPTPVCGSGYARSFPAALRKAFL